MPQDDDQNTTNEPFQIHVDALKLYKAARAKVDGAIAERMKLGGASLTCTQGCATCCTAGLEILPVEIFAIQSFLEEEGLNAIPAFQTAFCPFLDSDFACSIYDARPFVCRTQGLALRLDDEEQELVRFKVHDKNIAACQLNFTDREPRQDEILDLTSTQALLTLINSKYCLEHNITTDERIPLASVADAVFEELVQQGILEQVSETV